METMNISLPTKLKSFVDSQIDTGGYSSASEYVRRLIRDDQQRRWRDDVDQKLLEAIDSGSTPMTTKDWEVLGRTVRQRASKRARK